MTNFSGSPTDYYSWGDGEPNNFEGSENCIEGQFYAGVEGLAYFWQFIMDL